MTTEQQLQALGKHALEQIKECISEGGFALDVEPLADYCVKIGLIQYVLFDAAKHTDMEPEDYEDGDMVYYWGAK